MGKGVARDGGELTSLLDGGTWEDVGSPTHSRKWLNPVIPPYLPALT